MAAIVEDTDATAAATKTLDSIAQTSDAAPPQRPARRTGTTDLEMISAKDIVSDLHDPESLHKDLPPTDDPLELKNLVAQLESTLSSHTKIITQLKDEKEDLQAEVDVQANKLNALEKAGTFASTAKGAMEAQLKEERKRRELAEETVEMLRGKLEESRKAIGSLQQQDKRSSAVSSAGLGGMGLISPTSATGSVFGGGGGDGDLGGLGFIGGRDSTGSDTRNSRRESGLGLGRPFALNGGSRKISDGLSSSASEPVFGSSSHIPPPVTARSGLRELRLGTPGSIATPTSPSPTGLTSPSAEPSSFLPSPARTPTRSRGQSYNRGGSPGKPGLMLGELASGSGTDQIEENYPGAKLKSMGFSGRPHASRGSSNGSHHEQDGDMGSAVIDLSDQHLPSETNKTATAQQLAELEAKEGAATAKATEALEAAEEMKKEVAVLKGRLMESQEARESSERALKALREFISTSAQATENEVPESDPGSIGGPGRNSIVGLKLPPLPTDMDTEEEEAQLAVSALAGRKASKSTATAWRSPSFSLWKSAAPSGASGTNPPDLLRKASTSPSVAPSTMSVLSNPESVTSPPMSPPISMQDKELPAEAPATPATGGTRGSFVASWSKSIASPAPTTPLNAVTSPEMGSNAIPGQAGPAVKRAFSFFGSGISRTKSSAANSIAATDGSNDTTLDINIVQEDEAGEERFRERLATDEYELDTALAEASLSLAEPTTPTGPSKDLSLPAEDFRAPTPESPKPLQSTAPLSLKRRTDPPTATDETTREDAGVTYAV